MLVEVLLCDDVFDRLLTDLLLYFVKRRSVGQTVSAFVIVRTVEVVGPECLSLHLNVS